MERAKEDKEHLTWLDFFVKVLFEKPQMKREAA